MSAATAIDWRRLADSIADAWRGRLPRSEALELARGALLPLSLGGRRGASALAESVAAAVAHRRDVLREAALAPLADGAIAALIADALSIYLVAALDATLADRANHTLLGVECRRVSVGVWCGRAVALVVYLVRRDLADWRVSIGEARVADYDSRHALAVGTGATPRSAAISAYSRLSFDVQKNLLDHSYERMHDDNQDDAA